MEYLEIVHLLSPSLPASVASQLNNADPVFHVGEMFRIALSFAISFC